MNNRVAIVGLCVLCFVASAVAETVTVTRETQLGNITGLQQKHLNSTVEVYLGIPYIDKTVQRFEKPRLHLGWQPETLNATRYSNHCIQNEELNGYLFSQLGSRNMNLRMNEDCLFLNVFTPKNEQEPPTPSNEDETEESRPSYPVLVIIHGGSFVAGSAEIVDARVLAAVERTVVVTINYRLGVYGFLYLGEEFEDVLPKNLGILDLVAGLTWIKQHIRDFYGDPNRVTIAGHSAGATAVLLLLRHPSYNKLFHQSIIMSRPAILNMPMNPSVIIANSKVFLQKSSALSQCPQNGDNWIEIINCIRDKQVPFLDTNSAHMEMYPVMDSITSSPHQFHEFDAFFPSDTSMLNGHRTLMGTIKYEEVNKMELPYLKRYYMSYCLFAYPFDTCKSQFQEQLEIGIRKMLRSLLESTAENVTQLENAIFHEYGLKGIDETKGMDLTQLMEMSTDVNYVAPMCDMTMGFHRAAADVFQYRFEYVRPFNGAEENDDDICSNCRRLSALQHEKDIPFALGWYFLNKTSYDISRPLDKQVSQNMMSLFGTFIRNESIATLVGQTEEPKYNPTARPFITIGSEDGDTALQAKNFIRERFVDFWLNIFPDIKGLLSEPCHQKGIK